jgi:hypothetical protein
MSFAPVMIKEGSVIDNGVPADWRSGFKVTVFYKVVIWSLSNEFYIIHSESVCLYTSRSLDEKIVKSGFGLEGDGIWGDLIVGGDNISDQKLVPEDLSTWFLKRFSLLSCIFEGEGELVRFFWDYVVILWEGEDFGDDCALSGG